VAAIETIRHQLSLAVRVDDHFTGAPWPDEVVVSLDTAEPPVRAQGGGTRHADGTYRFAGLLPGARQLTVAVPGGAAFPWAASTAVTLPLGAPATPVVVELWPSPAARIAAGTIAIRGRLVTAAAGQEVRMEARGGAAPRNRRTRCDAAGELVFVVVGSMAQNAAGLIELDVTVPGRTVASIQVLDGGAVATTFPGAMFAVPPGRQTRALFHLT
jgi:hypothetical protein